MDPQTTALVVLGGVVGQDFLKKLLGPAADYLGEQGKELTRKAVENLGRILTIARRKLGNRAEQPGSIPPRTVQKLLTDGSFIDDDVCAEYFGGVVASSRSQTGRDDRGTFFLDMIGRLSTYQIRAHYVFYSCLRQLYRAPDCDLDNIQHCDAARVYIAEGAFKRAMDYQPSEDAERLTSHVLWGLAKEQLIGHFISGSAELLRRMKSSVPGDGIVMTPTPVGAELFLWAHGRADLPLKALLDCDIDQSSLSSVILPDRDSIAGN
jgi:hypothetical protein